jgi:hypothetical protein
MDRPREGTGLKELDYCKVKLQYHATTALIPYTKKVKCAYSDFQTTAISYMERSME